MLKTEQITIQFTNNFGKTFTLDPALVRFLKIRKVFVETKTLREMAGDILFESRMPMLREEKKEILIRLGQFLLDSDSITVSHYDNTIAG